MRAAPFSEANLLRRRRQLGWRAALPLSGCWSPWALCSPELGLQEPLLPTAHPSPWALGGLASMEGQRGRTGAGVSFLMNTSAGFSGMVATPWGIPMELLSHSLSPRWRWVMRKCPGKAWSLGTSQRHTARVMGQVSPPQTAGTQGGHGVLPSQPWQALCLPWGWGGAGPLCSTRAGSPLGLVSQGQIQ